MASICQLGSKLKNNYERVECCDVTLLLYHKLGGWHEPLVTEAHQSKVDLEI